MGDLETVEGEAVVAVVNDVVAIRLLPRVIDHVEDEASGFNTAWFGMYPVVVVVVVVVVESAIKAGAKIELTTCFNNNNIV